MNVQLIDNYVGHDGRSYFCRGCGRAGFESVASVRGHLAHCVSKHQHLPAPSRLAHEATSDVGLSSFSGGSGAVEVNDGGNMVRMWGTMRKIDERLDRIEKTLYNEIPHQIAVAQAQRTQLQTVDDFKWVKWVIVGCVAVWLLRKLGDDSVVKKAGSKISDKVLGKAIDGLLGL